MGNRKVTVVKLCKMPDGAWKRYPVVFSKNGRIKPGVIVIDGEEREAPAVSRYQVRWYEGKTTTYKDVGDSGADALAAMHRQSQLLIAREASKNAGVTIDEGVVRLNLVREMARFVNATEDRGSIVAAGIYQTAVKEFLEVTGRVYADELTGLDMTRYQKALRARGCSDRTISNRHQNVLSFLRWLKLDVKALAPNRPRYEKTLPEVYSVEEMQKFFATIDDEKLRLTYEILLKCGLREQEAMYLEWTNVDLKRAMLRVRANARFRFKVKDCEQRDVPIPLDLAERLRRYREKHSDVRLVTGTKTDRPNTKLLRTLKRLVNRAKLNCKNCDGCRSHQECSGWFLHKFRATYITMLLRSGMDLRTVMKLSGHSDLESVMRYLSPAGDAVVREHVNAIKWEG
jgi:integrase